MESISDIEQMAEAAWDAGHNRLAQRLLQRGADLGSDGCMLNLGYAYDVGLGTRTDKVMAMRWYKRAYRRGHASAASNIAVLYREQGRDRMVFAWYLRAAELGDGGAMLELAKLLLAGRGVRRSPSEALGYLRGALSTKFICEESWEEAEELMQQLAPKIVHE
ncbi:tetratricopeptide repeat protein [Luteolibacter rhizosphaerae]|nr:hypothetical protein [Luteolibacter rhizosphaerae]